MLNMLFWHTVYLIQLQLRFSNEDLPLLENEVGDFEEWLDGAERTLDNTLRQTQTEPEAIRKQYNTMRGFSEDVIAHAADIKFVVKGGQKYLESAKVMLYQKFNPLSVFNLL